MRRVALLSSIFLLASPAFSGGSELDYAARQGLTPLAALLSKTEAASGMRVKRCVWTAPKRGSCTVSLTGTLRCTAVAQVRLAGGSDYIWLTRLECQRPFRNLH